MARVSNRKLFLRKLDEDKSNATKKNVLRPRKKAKKAPNKKEVKKKTKAAESKSKPLPSEVMYTARRESNERKRRVKLQKLLNLQKANAKKADF
uniref:Uncharacterized protein n=1 Tax=Acrobeloides nanus TaxID=290746 RepID=A0A914EFQ6_9BILA